MKPGRWKTADRGAEAGADGVVSAAAAEEADGLLLTESGADGAEAEAGAEGINSR